jgi:hypothetical protein
MVQIASGGSWKTTITLVNPSSNASIVRLNFWDNDGRSIPLPLTFPQSGGPPPSTTASIEQSIGPRQVLVIETEAPVSGPTLVAWAELSASSGVTGFAVFRQRVQAGKDTEAVVPLQDTNRSAYWIPFDDANGFVTAVALANPSVSESITVTATFNDDLGYQLGSRSIVLGPHGHAAFALADQFVGVVGRRGIVEFRAPSSGSIGVLGLRFNPYGSFTSIPPIAR